MHLHRQRYARTYHGGEEGGTSQEGGRGTELHGCSWFEKRVGDVLCVV